MKISLILLSCLFLIHCTSSRIVLPRQFDHSLPLEERKELYSKNKLTYKSGFLGAPRFKIGDQPAHFSEYQVTVYFLTLSSSVYVQYENALRSQGLSAAFYTLGVVYTALGAVYSLPPYYSSFSFISPGALYLLTGGLSLLTGIIFGVVSINQFINAVSTYNFDLQEKLSLKKGELSFGGSDQLGLFYHFRF